MLIDVLVVGFLGLLALLCILGAAENYSTMKRIDRLKDLL